mmetsp:Transcript_49538/g.155213  ORF Transcript_49538/g.155213 Transcript_49538/m.155213 type:complete len:87 (+) Transcript_49538:211-471(+)
MMRNHGSGCRPFHHFNYTENLSACSQSTRTQAQLNVHVRVMKPANEFFARLRFIVPYFISTCLFCPPSSHIYLSSIIVLIHIIIIS